MVRHGKNNIPFKKQTKVAFKRLCGPTAIGGLNIPQAYTLNKGLIMNNTNQLLLEIKKTEEENTTKDNLYDMHKHALTSSGINLITDLIKLGGHRKKDCKTGIHTF